MSREVAVVIKHIKLFNFSVCSTYKKSTFKKNK